MKPEGVGVDKNKENGNLDVQKQIQEYLKKVEKNLKGFTREAKNSIIIEIEEHIREKMEEWEKGEGGQEEHTEKTDDATGQAKIQEILEEYGDPKSVAKAYSPILRLSHKGRGLFQGYSLLISLYFLYYTLPQFLYPIEDFDDQWELTVIGIIGTFIAYVCIFFNLIYVSNAEKLIKYSRFSLYANTLLGTIFLFLVLGGYLQSLGASHIDKDDFLTVDYTSETLYFSTLLVCSGILSFYISSLGHSMMTQDTKDGIAPYQNISIIILPILLVINVLSLLVISRQMWDTFDFLSKWNSPSSYWCLVSRCSSCFSPELF